MRIIVHFHKSLRAQRSSCRAREAAFGGAAVVKSIAAVCQGTVASRNYDGFAAERSLAGSAAATVFWGLFGLRQQLHAQVQREHAVEAQRVNAAEFGNTLHAVTQAVAVNAQRIGTGLALAIVFAPAS